VAGKIGNDGATAATTAPDPDRHRVVQQKGNISCRTACYYAGRLTRTLNYCSIKIETPGHHSMTDHNPIAPLPEYEWLLPPW